MANHIVSVLTQWHPQKDNLDWVLATVIATQGSSYRKPGAMMLINSLGQYFGLVSGGCLESDIMRQARKCWLDGTQRHVVYDMQDEDDFAWKLGIGCGGRVDILLQPITAENNYLELNTLLAKLNSAETVYYSQRLDLNESENTCLDIAPDFFQRNQIYQTDESQCFIAKHNPLIRLAIFGGGVDAQPLAKLADVLGWQVKLFDERLSYAKASYFPDKCHIIRDKYCELEPRLALASCNAVIVMNHNIMMDAEALKAAQIAEVPYIGILGPNHRTVRVLKAAGLTPQDFTGHVANPVGLALGGELPESIALAIIAEVHAHLHNVEPHTLNSFKELTACLQITA
ncbi:MAG: XdhC family protein [Aestuariibacter sp.]